MAKMAYTLSELQALGEDMDLAGVDVVDAEQPRILEVSLYCITPFSNVFIYALACISPQGG